MPRRSAASIEAAPYGPLSSLPRLKPPASMSEGARKLFLDLVLGCREGHFQATDLPLLVRYAEAHAMAERAETEMARQPLLEDRPNPWLTILGQSTKAATALAIRLRLSPQARAPNNPSRPAPPVSYYDRLALEQQQREEDAQHDG
jgi:hypothetical protein